MDNIDIFGRALQDYHEDYYSEDIVVHSSIAEDDVIPIPYLFREFEEMPVIEQKALELCKGKTLDIGFGAGSHLMWLQDNDIDASGIDISEGAVTLSRKRTLKNTHHAHLLEYQGTYDTLLLLMNGTGIFEKVSKVDEYLKHLKSLLAEGGQILIDGSDIKYMYEDEDGGLWIDTHRDYYGEVTYAMSYKGQRGATFDWLYLDFELLKYYANKNELNCELILEGDHYEYLARLTVA
ncbi:class I SAM-dependent methyltransferase [Dokdonia sinensis]|uniref:Class I SAM-dependent methyltransferase n=1 Tax=Dokdonia sinensis TaxID=2479847 RepID=A0A3M0FY19_9FLAO|nr:methyltransferase domain-containing protein [Dokdonia sinensis]RMB57574.1 class I SAM-dependent methyltransferase [Dokdonia sinensis]